MRSREEEISMEARFTDEIAELLRESNDNHDAWISYLCDLATQHCRDRDVLLLYLIAKAEGYTFMSQEAIFLQLGRSKARYINCYALYQNRCFDTDYLDAQIDENALQHFSVFEEKLMQLDLQPVVHSLPQEIRINAIDWLRTVLYDQAAQYAAEQRLDQSNEHTASSRCV